MRVKIKIPRRDLIKEDDYKEKVKEHYLEWKKDLLEKAKKVKDLKELRKIMDELDRNQFDWDSATGDWLEKSEPYEIICVTIRLPGLKDGYERYSIYGILSFSKGLSDSFDHTGDLERLIYIKNDKNHYFSFSTVGHGYLELFPEILGYYESFEELIKNEEYVFEVGDHSLNTERDDTKILIGKIPFIDIFRIVKTNIYKNHLHKKIPILSFKEMEDKLEINWYDYAKEVIKIDRYIKKELKNYSLYYRFKRSFYKFLNFIKKKREIDYLYLLSAIRTTIWQVSPLKQEKIIRNLKKHVEKLKISQDIETKIPNMIDSFIYNLDNLVDPIEFLKWQCREDSNKLKKKFKIEILKDFKPSALNTLPVAFVELLNKSLDDIGYPEKHSPKEKGKRIIFWIAGNLYRILRSQFANISKKVSDRFKTITTVADKIAFKEDIDESN